MTYVPCLCFDLPHLKKINNWILVIHSTFFAFLSIFYFLQPVHQCWIKINKFYDFANFFQSLLTSPVLPQFSGLYIVSLVVILIGFILFNTVPTLNRSLAPASEEEGCDNHAAEFDNSSIQGCVDEISRAQAEQDQIKSRLDERQSACVVINSVQM